MKYIQKGKDPASFSRWKSEDKMYKRGKPKWKRLPSSAKKELQNALIEEQGGICCYCGTRVDTENSHVEHFRPREKFPELQLEYENILCSCQFELQKKEPRHCGNAKGSWFDDALIVSPLSPDCEERFEFLENGRIRPRHRQDKGAAETIKRLALDISKLRELRKAAIFAALDQLESLDDSELQDLIRIYSRPNPVTRQFQPFCMAIVDILDSLL